mgnify:CR=1 FL=1
MPGQKVNPNRMELMRLKKRLQVARRGHKLLKDKRDEMMRQYLNLIQENAVLRQKTEELLTAAGSELLFTSVEMTPEELDTALMSSTNQLDILVSHSYMMGLAVPEIEVVGYEETDQVSYGKWPLPYSYYSVAPELDQALLAVRAAIPYIIALASLEKKTQLLGAEISKTRRRVNSLEYRMIPDLESTIRTITMKMDENERSNTTRLMKVKDLILTQERGEAAANSARAAAATGTDAP